MSKPRILVTRRWPSAVEAVLSERFDTTLNRDDAALDAGQLREALLTYDAVLPTVSDKLPAALFEERSAQRSSVISVSASTTSISLLPRKKA